MCNPFCITNVKNNKNTLQKKLEHSFAQMNERTSLFSRCDG